MDIVQFLHVLADGEKRVILQAMKHWEECTCIRFRPRTDEDEFSVMFISGIARE